MKPEERRVWAATMQKLSEADDASAVAVGRDFIKFGQWLNGGALAAMPVVAGVIGLTGQDAKAALLIPGIAFAGGLACTAFSTALTFLALASRSSSRLVISDAVLMEVQFPDPSRQISEQTVLAVLEESRIKREEGDAAFKAFARCRGSAFAAASASVACFAAGVFFAANHLL